MNFKFINGFPSVSQFLFAFFCISDSFAFMSITQSFDRHFLSSYYVPSITGDNPVTKSVYSQGLSSSGEDKGLQMGQGRAGYCGTQSNN